MYRKINMLIGTVVTALSFPPPALAQDLNVPVPTGFRITQLGNLISAAFFLLLIIAGLLAFGYLILGGIQWITSGGDKAGLEAARNKIIHAVVGLIVVFSAWAITILVQNFLGVTFLGADINIPRPY